MMAAQGTMLELKALHYAYPLRGARRAVLRGVGLRIERGELLALIGANGSGKTTLLRLMAGTLRPDAGDVWLEGRSLAAWDRRGIARRIAVLPQAVDLPSGFRVAEVVDMGRAPHARRLFGSTAQDVAAVHAALRDADALELTERGVDELSGGERQRVLVAMALAQEPALLLLDEPTLHLDLAHQVSLFRTIGRLRRQRSLTVVAVLHDLQLASALFPRVAVLDQGRIVADGAPAQVLGTEMVRRTFGVAMEEATGIDGRRHLVLSGH